eukprot:scaffold2422_cov120-Isochrysis_galbana.AAC.6
MERSSAEQTETECSNPVSSARPRRASRVRAHTRHSWAEAHQRRDEPPIHAARRRRPDWTRRPPQAEWRVRSHPPHAAALATRPGAPSAVPPVGCAALVAGGTELSVAAAAKPEAWTVRHARPSPQKAPDSHSARAGPGPPCAAKAAVAGGAAGAASGFADAVEQAVAKSGYLPLRTGGRPRRRAPVNHGVRGPQLGWAAPAEAHRWVGTAHADPAASPPRAHGCAGLWPGGGAAVDPDGSLHNATVPPHASGADEAHSRVTESAEQPAAGGAWGHCTGGPGGPGRAAPCGPARARGPPASGVAKAGASAGHLQFAPEA